MNRWFGRLGLAVVIVVFLLIQLVMLLDSEVTKPTPPVQDGVLDATAWNFDESGMMRLDGTWRFYPNTLAEPAGLPAAGGSFIRVPDNWANKELGQPVYGNGTYEAVVRLSPSAPPVIGIKVTNIRMSHRLYVNGQLVHESGVPAETKAAHRPNNTPYTAYVPVVNNELHFVIQVSNFKYYQGGIAQPILIGTTEQVTRYALLSFGVGLVDFMMTVSFGLYSLAIYLMRSRDKMYLYAGLFFLAVSLVVACADEKVLMVVLDWLPFDLAYKLQDLTLSGSLLLLLAFFRQVEPAFVPKKVYLGITLPMLLYFAAVLVMPYEAYINAKMLFSPYQLIVCLISIVRWSALLYRAKTRESRGERALMLATALFLTGSLLFQYLYLDQIMSSKMLSFVSYFSFIFTMNLYLAFCSTNAMRRTEQLSNQLWHANEVKNEFLQRTSHELKTPLHGIHNLAEHVLRRTETLPDESRRHLGFVVDTTQRLSYIVNNLIDATQLRNMSLQVKLASVDLAAVAEHVFRIISLQIGLKPVALVNRVADRTYVNADEQRLSQIIYNVLSNAVKYSNAGSIVVSASLKYERVTLHIADEGIGIAEEEREAVFQDRYRSDMPGQPPVDGMGLSLFISRELARQMGGELYIAATEVGRGTTMALELETAAAPPANPLPSVRREAMQQVAAAMLAPPEQRERSDRRAILIVDDDPANLEVLRLILQDDYELAVAYGGEEALLLVERRRFDLMITDLIMPGMSGMELTKRVRERFAAIALPIVIATAASRDSDIQLAYRAGATDYIAKPFSADEIRKRVQLLLQLSGTMETALQHERAFLAAQIKPHFLYNALNNIIAVCYEEPAQAAELLTLLSRHLRRMFQQESMAHTIPLKQELDLVRDYVEIEKLRFGDRLRFVMDIDPGLSLEQLHVKTLLIQPLVENAIGHGVFNKKGAGTVALRIRQEELHLRIEVEDDGTGMEADTVQRLLSGEGGRGVGLTNVRKRVASVAGAEFRLQSSPGRGTLCTVMLPRHFSVGG